jgi:hypothetical protein
MGLGMLEGGWANSIYSGYGAPVLSGWMYGWSFLVLDGFWPVVWPLVASSRPVLRYPAPERTALRLTARIPVIFFSPIASHGVFLLDKFTMLMLGRLFAFFSYRIYRIV